MSSRPLYQAGEYLSAADLQAEQQYRLENLRRHNRRLHGWGVICGLWVAPVNDPARPWAVQICPGYAIGPYGDEIEVTCPASVNIPDFLWMEPALGRRGAVYIAIRYEQRPASPSAATTAGCGCPDPDYHPSRLRDGYKTGALWSPPKSLREPDLCDRTIAPCPDCPESPWLVLARVRLPASEADPIRAAHIDNGVFRKKL
jgi:hypothetical protein